MSTSTAKAENYRTLNCNMPRTAKSQWMEAGSYLQVGLSRKLRLITRLDDGLPVAIFREEFGPTFKHIVIDDGVIISMPYRHGFVEVIPKAIKFSKAGYPEKILIDIADIPATEFLH